MPSAAERAGHERVTAAAHKGRAEVEAGPGDHVDFATLFHVASDPKLDWPKAVEAWGAKSPANEHLLAQIRAETNHPAVDRAVVMDLIRELLKAVNG